MLMNRPSPFAFAAAVLSTAGLVAFTAVGMIKVEIACAHCTKPFKIEIPETGVGSMGEQHSPGCGKWTRVYWNHGKITKTEATK